MNTSYNLRTRTRVVDYSESALSQRLSLPDHTVFDGGLGSSGFEFTAPNSSVKRRSGAKRPRTKRRRNQESSLNDLPDDCLLSIFKKVHGIREKVRLGRGTWLTPNAVSPAPLTFVF